MADLPPAMGKVMAPIKKSSDPASRSDVRLLPPVTVRYYQRMKRQRVYPLVVRWNTAKSGQSLAADESAPLVVRPVVPGAQVVPAELPLEPGQPDAAATFKVTPLARGQLPGAHVEVLHHGRIVDNVPLKIKVIRISLSCLFLTLAFLVPLLLILTTGKNQLTAQAKWQRIEGSEKIAANAKPSKEAAPPGKGANAGDKNADPAKTSAKGKAKTKDKGRGQDDDEKPRKMTQLAFQKPGEILEEHLNGVLPPVPGISAPITWALGAGYQFICDFAQKEPQWTVYGPFIVFGALSILLFTRGRGSVRGHPLALPRA
jgi:hypothetical protein